MTFLTYVYKLYQHKPPKYCKFKDKIKKSKRFYHGSFYHVIFLEIIASQLFFIEIMVEKLLINYGKRNNTF